MAEDEDWDEVLEGEEGGEGGEGDAGLTSEWENMMGDGTDDSDTDSIATRVDDGGTARVLNQNEIDGLLGFDSSPDADDTEGGIQAILNSALVSYERLPMLEVVFDRLIRLLTTSLRNFTSDSVELSLDTVQSLRFGDYLNSIPLPAMIAVFKAEEWDNHGLMTVDSSLIYSIIDVLLGGRRGTAAMRIEGRPYTTIERSLVERLLQMVLNDLSAAFDPLSPVTLRFERLETNPRFATISRPSNAAIIARLRVDMDDRGGTIELIFPYATLEPIRELLLQMFMGEKFGRDSIWETHLSRELWQTEIELEAIMGEQISSLREVLTWEVGSQIVFNVTPNTKVRFRSGGKDMFLGRMGRKGAKLAIKLEDQMIGQDQMVEDPEDELGDNV